MREGRGDQSLCRGTPFFVAIKKKYLVNFLLLQPHPLLSLLLLLLLCSTKLLLRRRKTVCVLLFSLLVWGVHFHNSLPEQISYVNNYHKRLDFNCWRLFLRPKTTHQSETIVIFTMHDVSIKAVIGWSLQIKLQLVGSVFHARPLLKCSPNGKFSFIPNVLERTPLSHVVSSEVDC